MEVDIQRLVHLGKGELTMLPGEGIGGIGCRLLPQLFLESWILRSPFKEVLVCTVQVAKRLLNGHRGDISKPEVFFLQRGQQSGKIVIGELLPVLEIGVLAGCESPIVDEAAASERLCKKMLLFLSR